MKFSPFLASLYMILPKQAGAEFTQDLLCTKQTRFDRDSLQLNMSFFKVVLAQGPSRSSPQSPRLLYLSWPSQPPPPSLCSFSLKAKTKNLSCLLRSSEAILLCCLSASIFLPFSDSPFPSSYLPTRPILETAFSLKGILLGATIRTF